MIQVCIAEVLNISSENEEGLRMTCIWEMRKLERPRIRSDSGLAIQSSV